MPHDDIVTPTMQEIIIYNQKRAEQMASEYLEPADASVNTPPPDAPPNETKAEKFKRIATYRLTQTRERIRLLGNCANQYNYEYSPEQVAKIVTILRKDIDALEAMFTTTPEKDDLTVEL